MAGMDWLEYCELYGLNRNVSLKDAATDAAFVFKYPRQSRPSAHSEMARAHRSEPGGMLSVLAGMTDAIGFMASGDFVSFMSGNTTRMAVAISAGDLGLTLRLVILVATFIVGNALGIIVSRLGGRRALPLAAVHRHPAVRCRRLAF